MSIVFNAGGCYALSTRALQLLTPVFSSHDFIGNKDRLRWSDQCHCICAHRPGAMEDPTIRICLHRFGIEPLNTLSHDLRERFSPFKKENMDRLGFLNRTNWWYFKMKPSNLSLGSKSMVEHAISYHFYKKAPLHPFELLHKQFNRPESRRRYGTRTLMVL